MERTSLEQRIVDQYLTYSYPEELETPIDDVVPVQMETAQPVAPAPEPISQPTGSIREIPRNMFEQALGKFGEALTAAGVQLDKVGIDIPALGRVTLKDLTVGDMGKVIEDMSYGFPPTRGAGGIGGTSGLKPEAAELLNLPIVGTAARATGTVAAAGARFAAPKVGEMLDSYMRRSGLTFDLMAYHGSPQRFEKFEASKIGTGAKAQAYGYGMYFSENPEIAQTYKIGLTNPALQLTQELENVLPDVLKGKAPDWVDEISSGKTFGDLLATLNQPWQKTLLRQNKNQIEALIKRQQTGGALYTVEIPDETVSKMLDWDKLISEQSQEIQQLAKQYGLTDPDYMGGDLIAAVNAKKPDGAKILSDAGITGVRYIDRSPRAKGKDARNIVVFPGGEDQIKILKVE
jgi:hypothetical protein